MSKAKKDKADKPNEKMTILEVLVIILIVLILAAILLQVLAVHPDERAPRRYCINQLKQLSSILQMYALENNGRYPPIDDAKNNFIFDGDILYPEYLTDPLLAACPSDWDYKKRKSFRLRSTEHHPDASRREFHADCITNMSYCYLGWLLTSELDAAAFFAAYLGLSSEERYESLIVPPGYGSGGGSVIYRLESGAEELVENPELKASDIPVMWDMLSTNITDFNHYPALCHVLYLDGHVETIRYDLGSTEIPVSPLFAAIIGGYPREPIPDCE